MAFLDWSSELSVDFEEIDNDHKRLVEMLNFLSDAVTHAKEDAAIGQLLDDLLGYTMCWIQISSATPNDLTKASNGVRKPRHFLGVVL